MPAATDTSFLPPMPGTAERPGVDEREHPGRLSGSGSDSCIAYLREVQRVIVEANLQDQLAQRREPH